jgi:hypothetical protein
VISQLASPQEFLGKIPQIEKTEILARAAMREAWRNIGLAIKPWSHNARYILSQMPWDICGYDLYFPRIQ